MNIAIGFIFVVGSIALFVYIADKKSKLSNRGSATIAASQESIRKLQDAFDRLPNKFLPIEIKQLVGQGILEFTEMSYKRSQGSPRFKAQLDQAKSQLSELGKSKPSHRIKARKAEPGEEIRERLKTVRQYVHHCTKIGRIGGRTGSSYLQLIEQLFAENIVDFFSQPAQDALHNKDPHLAMKYYYDAMLKLSSKNTRGRYNNKIKKLKAQISRIEKESSPVSRQPSGISQLAASFDLEEEEFRQANTMKRDYE